jgi:17beta-estradiol 17-dehydrogenase / very-long-chain 3-oxoacyl-CoA reductase
VITGASDGIGKEFALQLAQKDFNIILVSRTASKLEALATEISSKFSEVKTKCLAMDFAKDSAEDYQKLAEIVDGLDVAILVNNVGKSHDMPVSFLETDEVEMVDIITINVKGTLKVTKVVAPGMVARRRGLILTMGSFGGFLPTPLLATYSGSKAFLQYWSTALGAELKPHGVQTQLVIGYLITSAMSKIRKPSLTIPTPKSFVKSTLGKIGLKGTAGGMVGTITPFWSHGIMHWAIQEFLGVWSGTVLNQNRAMHESIRKRALRKKEREAAGVKKST